MIRTTDFLYKQKQCFSIQMLNKPSHISRNRTYLQDRHLNVIKINETNLQKSITSSHIPKVLKEKIVVTVRMTKHTEMQQQRDRNVFKLTTIFSAASQILSTLASDNPLIPVRFYIKSKDSKQSRLIQSMIHPIRIQ